jgi:hypothetical protein
MHWHCSISLFTFELDHMSSPYKLRHDIGLLLLKVLILSAYVALIFIKPAGEGWGRGWNLIAYWIYAAPAVLIVGGLHVWRQKVIAKKSNGFDALITFLAFIFPLVALLVLKLKA